MVNAVGNGRAFIKHSQKVTHSRESMGQAGKPFHSSAEWQRHRTAHPDPGVCGQFQGAAGRIQSWNDFKVRKLVNVLKVFILL